MLELKILQYNAMVNQNLLRLIWFMFIKMGQIWSACVGPNVMPHGVVLCMPGDATSVLCIACVRPNVMPNVMYCACQAQCYAKRCGHQAVGDPLGQGRCVTVGGRNQTACYQPQWWITIGDDDCGGEVMVMVMVMVDVMMILILLVKLSL